MSWPAPSCNAQKLHQRINPNRLARSCEVRWSNEGLMLPTSILEAATLHQSVMPVCRCGHSARFEAHCLWWHFERRSWDDRLSTALSRFWCRICASGNRERVRPVRLEVVKHEPGDIELPWPDERVWKRAVSRLR